MSNIVSMTNFRTDESKDQNQPSEELTMTSREIADLTGKQHKNVMADIRNMFEQLGIDSAEFSAQYRDSTGRFLPCFELDRYHTEVLVTGYDVKRRAAVIKRWYDLETGKAQPKLPNFDDPVEAARAWADVKEKLQIESAEKQKAEQEATTYKKAVGANRHSLNRFIRTLEGVNSQATVQHNCSPRYTTTHTNPYL